MALEFCSFNLQRRGLRVSAPATSSDQRGTYFLQFPLRYSVPLVVYFVLFHTFLSQTIILRRTFAIYPTSYTDPNVDALDRHLVSYIGYSPLAALAFAILLTLPVTFCLALGAIQLDWILPSTSGDSRAISVLCHLSPPTEQKTEEPQRPNSEPLSSGLDLLASKVDVSQAHSQIERQADVHLRKIRWGVTSVDIDGVGHCGFSLQPVRPPETGETFR